MDRFQVGHLQSLSLLFAFPEARNRWASVREFITSPPFTLGDGIDNGNRVNY